MNCLLSLSINDMKALLQVLDDYTDTDLPYVKEAAELKTPILESIVRAQYQQELAAKNGPGRLAYDVTARTADKGFLAFEFRMLEGEKHVHKLYQQLISDPKYVVCLKAVSA